MDDGEAKRLYSLLVSGENDLVLVFDYAEHRRSQICGIIEAAAQEASHRRVRIFLLAREPGFWWDALRRQKAMQWVEASAIHTLRLDVTRLDHHEFYHHALEHFRSIMPPVRYEPLNDDALVSIGTPLLLQLASLRTLSGQPAEQSPSPDDILRWAAQREERYAFDIAATRGIGLERAAQMKAAIARVQMAYGASSREDCITMLKRLPEFDGLTFEAPNVADALHEAYAGEKWIDPILPDRVNEHIVAQSLDPGIAGTDRTIDAVFGEDIDPANSA